jgi:hypothetical protein
MLNPYPHRYLRSAKAPQKRKQYQKLKNKSDNVQNKKI